MRLVVIGKPGTGKTSNGLKRIVQLSKENNSDRVCAISFSKATKQAIEAKLQDLDPDFKDCFTVKTLHSIIGSKLFSRERPKYGGNRKLYMNGYERSLFMKKNNGLNLSRGDVASKDDDLKTDGDIVFQHYNTFINIYPLLVGGNMFNVRPGIMTIFYENLKRMVSQYIDTYVSILSNDIKRVTKILRKHLLIFVSAWIKEQFDQHTYDYTGMLLKALDLGLMEAYPILWIDEAQDLSPLQIAILCPFIKNSTHVLITGDPDQSIYTFQGVLFPYLFSHDSYSELNLSNNHNFTDSYRVPQCICDEANNLISKNYIYDDSNFVTVTANNATSGIIKKVDCSYLSENQFRRNVFILSRLNAYCKGIAQYLTKKNVPFGWIKQDENTGWSNAFNNPLTVADMQTYLLFIQFKERLEKIGNLWKFDDAVFDSSIDRQTTEMLQCLSLEKIEADRRFNIINLWREHPELAQAIVNSDFSKLSIDKTRLDELRPLYSSGEWETPKIQLGTLHSSKGLETYTVIIDPRITNDIHKELRRSPFSDKAMAERRVWYTGITRATNNLYILDPAALRKKRRQH
ncbi:MAG TPA: AAA family ATPase, partial [bacterium]|nr:AAA family ATPase [bacterium]